MILFLQVFFDTLWRTVAFIAATIAVITIPVLPIAALWGATWTPLGIFLGLLLTIVLGITLLRFNDELTDGS